MPGFAITGFDGGKNALKIAQKFIKSKQQGGHTCPDR
jgi:hypothetical protein